MPWPLFPSRKVRLAALRQSLSDILRDTPHRRRTAHPHTALIVHPKTAVIHIYAALNRRLVIADNHFRMNKSGGIFIDLHAAGNQVPVIRFCHKVGIPAVWNGRQDNPHIHTALCGDA